MPYVSFLSTTLKQAGMRLTPQRLAICELLSETHTHPTAAAIYEQVRSQYPSLSLMTVYNTLNTLVDLGSVNALGNAGDDTIHYDGNTSPHINLACISCQKIEDVDSTKVAELDSEVSSTSGFKVIGASLLYYGVCPDCQKQTT
jgi:Fur family transcriptional regulator, peroxide stress response regulator